MFQSFASAASPAQGPPRLARLRAALAEAGYAGTIVPRADAHQGETVAPCDERLRWLTGFTGSAGVCVVLPDVAGVFVDGRYRAQVRGEVDLDAFTPVDWPATRPGPWIAAHLARGRIAYDPWLHTSEDVSALEKALEESAVTLHADGNFIDALWTGRPPPPQARAFVQPDALAGRTGAEKRHDTAADLRKAGARAAVLTLPDSICWLLNIRGADVARTPVVQAFAVLHDDAHVTLFADPAKFDAEVRAHLGPEVAIRPAADLTAALGALTGPVRVDPASAPVAVERALADAGVAVVHADDPCRLPKARKSAAELAGIREAHLRDGAAMAEFLAWLDAEAPGGGLTEMAVVEALEGFRSATGCLHDISFDTICGAGAHGAIVHYRVTEATDAPVRPGEVLLIDSGAQYPDGTTDVTRTVAVGTPPEGAAEAATRVLQGLIAISRARFPMGLAGRDLDPLARAPLWLAGQDYDHGTGHGVGAFLGVHEGPQRLSRLGLVPLEAGMILSNEPGYYREGAFGIRLENLVAVIPAPPLAGADDRAQLAFETLTFVPFDRRLILRAMLAPGEVAWIDAYHAEVRRRIAPRLSDAAARWLEASCRPL